jgi:hypothetical protein
MLTGQSQKLFEGVKKILQSTPTDDVYFSQRIFRQIILASPASREVAVCR